MDTTGFPRWADPATLTSLLGDPPTGDVDTLVLGGRLLRLFGLPPPLHRRVRAAVRALTTVIDPGDLEIQAMVLAEEIDRALVEVAEGRVPDAAGAFGLALLRDDLASLHAALAAAVLGGDPDGDRTAALDLLGASLGAWSRDLDARARPVVPRLQEACRDADGPPPELVDLLAWDPGAWWPGLAG
jgi:hypothetical protein